MSASMSTCNKLSLWGVVEEGVLPGNVISCMLETSSLEVGGSEFCRFSGGCRTEPGSTGVQTTTEMPPSKSVYVSGPTHTRFGK
jgi:hypothetical protein